jgi:hypothetical protein
MFKVCRILVASQDVILSPSHVMLSTFAALSVNSAKHLAFPLRVNSAKALPNQTAEILRSAPLRSG